MLQDDKAKRNIADDKLERKDFCERIADTITRIKPDDNFVIAITGEWGEGKTTVVYYVSNFLQEKNSTIEILEFNPWIYSDPEQLNKHFFNELIRISDGELKTNLKKYSKAIYGYVSKLDQKSISKTILKSVAAVGVGISIFPQGIIKYLTLIGSLCILAWDIISPFFKPRKSSAYKIKQKITKQMKSRKGKIVVVIDDLDRISAGELKSLMQLIRVNADFPNVIYLLAYDQKVVEKMLESSGFHSGKDYLCKIVNMSVGLPKVRKEKIWELLEEELNKFCDDVEESSKNSIEVDRIRDIFHCIKHFFRSIRDIKRFMNSLRTTSQLIMNDGFLEVNIADFIGIETIRCFYPELYDEIYINKNLFMGIDHSIKAINEKSHEEASTKRFTQFLESIDSIHATQVIDLLKILFYSASEALKELGTYKSWYQYDKNGLRALRIDTSEYFDSYFIRKPYYISQRQFYAILKASNDFENLELEILSIRKDKIVEMIRLFMDEIDDKILISKQKTKNWLKILNMISDEKYSENIEENYIYFSKPFNLFDEILTKQKHFNIYEFMKYLINKYSYTFATCLFLARREYRVRKNITTLSEMEYQELRMIWVEKIESIKNRYEILTKPDIRLVLEMWKTWSNNSEKYIDFVNHIFIDTKSFLLMINKLKVNRLNMPAVKNIFGLEKVRNHAQKILDNNTDLKQEYTELLKITIHNIDKEMDRNV